MIRSTLFNVAVTIAAFGMAPFFKKLAIVNGSSAWMAALVPVVCAALTTLLIAYSQRRELVACLFGRRQILALILVGVTATGLVTLLVAQALTTTTATNRSLFQAAYPAATLLLAHGLLGERLRLLQYGGIAVMMGGILLMNGSGGEVRFGQGFWLLCLTLPLIGFGDVYGKRLTRRLSPLLLSCGRSFYGALFIICTAPFLELGAWPGITNALWLAAAGVCQGLGIWTLYRAFRATKASLVASLIAAAPLVTASAELLFMDLALSAPQWFGVALVVSMAAWLAHSREAEQSAKPSTRAA